jgi:hypothetical protein
VFALVALLKFHFVSLCGGLYPLPRRPEFRFYNALHLIEAFARRAVQDCEQTHVMIRRQFSHRLFRADVCPSSMDAIAVEVAGPRRYHRRRR